MWRNCFIATSLLVLFSAGPHVFGVERGRGEEGRSSGRQSPGGAWGERSHQGGSGHRNYDQSRSREGASAERHEGEGELNRRPSEFSSSGATRSEAGQGNRSNLERRQPSNFEPKDAAAGAAAANRRGPQYSGAQGAAAGAAAANRNQPTYSGAEGAAAGAAAANRRGPQYSGAQGAAAGAAVANRNQPQISGAAGAAVGAAAANRNTPQLSGAQGAALGAAVANQNAPAVSGAQGAAIGAAAANQNNAAAAGAAGAAMGSAAVQNAFNNYSLYSQQWQTANPDAWSAGRWAAGNAWSPTSWRNVSSYYGSSAAPVWYDYGDNVTYQNGNIVMDGKSLGTAEQFSQQAADLAQSGTVAEPAADSDWLPLGVFAMVRNEQQHPQLVMQLAVNKQGMLRGNFTDEVSEHTQPIHGAIDPKTQRAAWIVGNHQSLIMEAGLSNLSEGDAPALIHKNGKTDHWLLVRLQQPGGKSAAGANLPK